LPAEDGMEGQQQPRHPPTLRRRHQPRFHAGPVFLGPDLSDHDLRQCYLQRRRHPRRAPDRHGQEFLLQRRDSLRRQVHLHRSIRFHPENFSAANSASLPRFFFENLARARESEIPASSPANSSVRLGKRRVRRTENIFQLLLRGDRQTAGQPVKLLVQAFHLFAQSLEQRPRVGRHFFHHGGGQNQVSGKPGGRSKGLQHFSPFKTAGLDRGSLRFQFAFNFRRRRGVGLGLHRIVPLHQAKKPAELTEFSAKIFGQPFPRKFHA